MYGNISLVSSAGGLSTATLLWSGATDALQVVVAATTLTFAVLAVGKLLPKRRPAPRR
ncbi:hypothetical protein [Kineococcus sp. SYSU DK002]|uniref:hypothetical protein n=1 Tax=Kineococcus sp. SYSU DK002 TaxID=3383123 RepID=UPI003D7EE439